MTSRDHGDRVVVRSQSCESGADLRRLGRDLYPAKHSSVRYEELRLFRPEDGDTVLGHPRDALLLEPNLDVVFLVDEDDP